MQFVELLRLQRRIPALLRLVRILHFHPRHAPAARLICTRWKRGDHSSQSTVWAPRSLLSNSICRFDLDLPYSIVLYFNWICGIRDAMRRCANWINSARVPLLCIILIASLTGLPALSSARVGRVCRVALADRFAAFLPARAGTPRTPLCGRVGPPHTARWRACLCASQPGARRGACCNRPPPPPLATWSRWDRRLLCVTRVWYYGKI